MKILPLYANPTDLRQHFISMASLWFTGVGAGAVDLLTIRAYALLVAADVVFYEAGHISPDILALISTKKQHSFSCLPSRETIAKKLLPAVQAGELVVRLHSGDPCLYSPAPEEFTYFTEHNISCAMVPGISAAFAAVATVNVSFTPTREIQSFAVTRPPVRTPMPVGQRVMDFCDSGCVIAIYLATKDLRDIAQQLKKSSLPSDATILLAEQVGWPKQRLTWTTITSLTADTQSMDVHPQSLLIVWPFALRRV